MAPHTYTWHLVITTLLLSLHTISAKPFTINTGTLSINNGTVGLLGTESIHCFTKDSHPGIGFTNSQDCREALRLMYRDPQRNEIQRFSKSPARHQGPVVGVPHGWQHNDCVIYISCANEVDIGSFTYLDAAKLAGPIIKRCVDQMVKSPKYGGLAPGVGASLSFYVAVGRPKGPPRRSISTSVGGMTTTTAAMSTGSALWTGTLGVFDEDGSEIDLRLPKDSA